MEARKQMLPEQDKESKIPTGVKLTLFGILGLFGLITLLSSFKVVNPGERGIRVTMGSASDEVLNEGVHFKVPFFSKIKTMSVRVQKTEATSEAATKDLQRVHATFALNWHVSSSQVVQMYRNVGSEVDVSERIINPAVAEVMKAATSQMSAEEVLSKRLELKASIDKQLVSRLSNYNVIVDDISLVNLDFTNQFNNAIEQKQVAEQKAKQAEYEALESIQKAKSAVNEAKGQAESALVKAKAEAEANRLKLQTLTPQLIQYETIQRWNGELPSVVGSGTVPFLNMNLKSTTSKEN